MAAVALSISPGPCKEPFNKTQHVSEIATLYQSKVKHSSGTDFTKQKLFSCSEVETHPQGWHFSVAAGSVHQVQSLVELIVVEHSKLGQVDQQKG